VRTGKSLFVWQNVGVEPQGGPVPNRKTTSLRRGISEKAFQQLHGKVVDVLFAARASSKAFADALGLIDALPDLQRNSARVSLLRVAILSGTGRRKTLESLLLDLDRRFPHETRIALELVEFYSDSGDDRAAWSWLNKADSWLTRNTHPELQEAAICFRAALLARRKRVRQAQRLLVAALQRSPYSSMLATALDDIRDEQPYFPTI
jgi:hypothetical protein